MDVKDVVDTFGERGVRLGDTTRHVDETGRTHFFSSFGVFAVSISQLRTGGWRLVTYRTTIFGNGLQSLADNTAFYLRRIRNMTKEALSNG